MPNFTARITAGDVNEAWAVGSEPVNTSAGRPHRHLRVTPTVTAVVAKATVGGVEGELDANLGGELFQWWWVSWPQFPSAPPKSLPALTLSAGQSSVCTVSLFPNTDTDWYGHWILGCYRENGGRVLIPFDVEGA